MAKGTRGAGAAAAGGRGAAAARGATSRPTAEEQELQEQNFKKKSLICKSLTHVVAEMVMGPEMKERPLFRLTRTSTDLHTGREMESCEEPAAAAAAQAKIKMNCVCSLDLAKGAGLIFIKTSQRQLGRFCLIIFILLDLWFKTPKQMRTTARNVTDLQH